MESSVTQLGVLSSVPGEMKRRGIQPDCNPGRLELNEIQPEWNPNQVKLTFKLLETSQSLEKRRHEREFLDI